MKLNFLAASLTGASLLSAVLLLGGCSFWSKSSKPAPKSDASAVVLLEQGTEYLCHELRTPLNSVIGFSDILKSGAFGEIENPKYREYAKDINDSGKHLLNLINDIL